MKNLVHEILKEVRVELLDEFDKNFADGGFFKSRWEKKLSGEPSNLQNSGKLRRSIKASLSGNTLTFTSTEPYAAIHNYGGAIKVTPKMKRFFWAKYYEIAGKDITKTGRKSNSRKAIKLRTKAEFYKNMALKKVGTTITIPQRQFIGKHPTITTIVQEIANKKMQELAKEIADNANKQIKR